MFRKYHHLVPVIVQRMRTAFNQGLTRSVDFRLHQVTVPKWTSDYLLVDATLRTPHYILFIYSIRRMDDPVKSCLNSVGGYTSVLHLCYMFENLYPNRTIIQ